MKILTTICFMLIMQTMAAQDNRLLFHYKRYKDVIYNIGDVISFREKGSKEKIKWPITDITDSTIVSGERSIAPHKIGAMYIDSKSKIFFPLRFKYKPTLIAGGVAYALLSTVNKQVDRSVLIVSTSMVATGFVIGVFARDYIKLKPGRRLVILR